MSANIENSSSGSAQATPAEASAETTVSGAVADPQDGACAPGTLHDFVSSLINDEAAKAAYLADPMGALGAAGLGDLSPADVLDALPLVADALPTDLAGLPGLGDLPLELPTGLPTGLPSLGDLPALGDLSSALPIDGLTSALPVDGLTGALPVDGLTGALPVDGLTGALPVDGLTGALPVDGLTSALPLDGLTDALPVDGLAGALPTDALSAVEGLPGALDAGGLSAVTGLAGALPTGGLTDALPLDGLTDALPVNGLTSALPVDGLTGALPVDGLTGALPVDGLTGALPVDGLTGALPVDGLTGALPVDGLTSALPVDGLTGALPVDGVTGALPMDGLPMDSLPDPSDVLPSGSLPSAGDLPVVGDLPVSLPTGLPSLDSLPITGALPVDLSAVTGLTDVLPTDGLPGLADLPVADLPQLPTLETPLGDVTAVVDGATGLAGIAADTDLVDTSASGLVSDLSDGVTLASHSESVLGGLAGEANVGQDFGGAVAGLAPLTSFAGNLGETNQGDLHAWGGANTPFGHTAVHVDAGMDGIGLAAVSPLGDLGANSDGDFVIQPADSADLLDVDNIGTTGDAVAGTVAHVVGSGSTAVADTVDTASENLGGFLTGTPLATVNSTVDSTTDTVSDTIHDGGQMLADQVPTTDVLPVDQLPQLPQLPDLPDVSSADLPEVGDVTGHLPVDLPQVQLPDTSAVTDLVSNNPVTDVVDHSPVGGLVDGVTSHLPQVGDHLPVVGDLDLGL